MLIMALAATVADPAPAASENNQAPIEVKGKRNPEEKVVCRVSVPIGSLIPVRRCATIAQRRYEQTQAISMKEKILEDREVRRQIQELRDPEPR